MKNFNRLWLLPAIIVAASGSYFGCSKDPLSPGNNDDNEAGDAGSGGSGTTSGGSAQGGSGDSANGGGSSTTEGGTAAGAGTATTCPVSACGPQLGIGNFTCEDGSLSGPTGRCLARENGTCGWEVRVCPSNVGGAGGQSSGGSSPAGGASGAAGEPNNGGANGDPCGGCASGERCIYQVGGPGPSHFACANQVACGALGACACIIGQGTCNMNLAGDGYCHCDNGLE